MEKKREHAYRVVEAARKKQPNTPIQHLCKNAKVSLSTYYAGRSALKGEKPNKTGNYEKITAATLSTPTLSPDRMIFVMGTPEQVRAFASEVMQ